MFHMKFLWAFSKIEKMRQVSVLIWVLFFVMPLWGRTITLQGRVVDADTLLPLAGATVEAGDSKSGCITDAEGNFMLSFSGELPVALTARYIGFYPTTLTVGSADTFVEIKLEQNNTLPNVIVYGSRNDVGTTSSQMSAVSLSAEEIKSIPSFLGEPDVLKGLQKLPGVTTANEGQAGIYVRGGNIDQNLITLDGSTIYNAEHLKGFVSAINSDMVDNVTFYNGAFPARYGSRLSSMVDIGIKEGDFQKYHGLVSLGMLSSRVQAEGPLWKGRTSFNVGARFSYFDLIMMPLLKSMYLHPDALNPYANMDYYDISAKLVHRFSDRDKLSAVFYLGHDVCDESPNAETNMTIEGSDRTDETLDSRTDNSWGNIVSSLYWTRQPNSRFLINSNLSFSRYFYNIGHRSENRVEKLIESPDGTEITVGEGDKLHFWKRISEDSRLSTVNNRSEINDWAFTTDFRLFCGDNHAVRWGGKLSYQTFEPVIDTYTAKYVWDITDGGKTVDEKKGQAGDILHVTMASAYVEDDWTISPHWKANLGLRYTLAATEGKIYQLLEPRASVCWLLRDDMSLKTSYSRTSQNLHRLNTTNMLFSTDLWVPITRNIPLMKSDQWAMGYNYDLPYSLTFTLEGYYKTMENILEYRDGAGYIASADNWQKQVAVGDGRSYGVEVMLRRQAKNTKGWIAYTWSKALRRFDRPGNVINNGEEFYALNDRRHNFNLYVSHRFPSGWQIGSSWTYQSGRRGTIASLSTYGGNMQDYSGLDNESSSVSYGEVLRTYVSERNNFILPPVHRLDFSVSFFYNHSWGVSEFNATIYNLYNRMNISNVYMSYSNGQPSLKGVCIFPFMPSFAYTLKF